MAKIKYPKGVETKLERKLYLLLKAARRLDLDEVKRVQFMAAGLVDHAVFNIVKWLKSKPVGVPPSSLQSQEIEDNAE